MKRLTQLVAIFFCFVALTGCNKPGEAVCKEMIDAVNGLTTAIESGEKSKIQAAMSKLATLSKDERLKAISASDKKTLDEKYKAQFEAAGKRLQGALATAISSGKMTQQDFMAIGKSMMEMP